MSRRTGPRGRVDTAAAARRSTAIATAIWLAAAVLLGPTTGAVSAQREGVSIIVELAPDPESRGPAAWTALRRGELGVLAPRDRPRRLGRDGDPPGPWQDRGAPRSGFGPAVYARTTIAVGGSALVEGTLGFDGVERLTISAGAAERAPAALRWLATAFAPEAGGAFVGIDLPALLDRIGPGDGGMPPGLDPGAASATIVDGVTLLARPLPNGGQVVVGAGPGGLLLPTLAAWSRLGAVPPTALGSTARLALIAATTFGAEREEAARQLAMRGDVEARRWLERLTWGDGALAEIATFGLGWHRSTDSLTTLAAVASDPARAPLARLVAARIAPALAATPAASAGSARGGSIAGGSIQGGSASPAEPPGRGTLVAILGGAALALAAAIGIVRRRC